MLGSSVRTLHHYDALGLVRPGAVSDAGYRLYDDAALARLQAVLFYRELGFALKDIRDILDAPGFDLTESLTKHRALLLLQRRRLNEMIAMVDNAIQGGTMPRKPVTKADIEALKQQYAQEARERWGHTAAFKESEKRNPTPQQEADAANAGQDIFAAFAELVGSPADAPAVQMLVKRWQDHISAHYYPCTKEILAGLGEMYVADERFQKNLDEHGAGTAALMRDAIRVYCAG